MGRLRIWRSISSHRCNLLVITMIICYRHPKSWYVLWSFVRFYYSILVISIEVSSRRFV